MNRLLPASRNFSQPSMAGNLHTSPGENNFISCLSGHVQKKSSFCRRHGSISA
uniref:Uncharacterized protein n=1 Tax=Parascaris univalens TaxID=6257 RepID=A0A915AG77_PARUN